MIQDINKNYNLNYKYDTKPSSDDYVLCYSNKGFYLISNNVPKYKDIKSNNIIYGFMVDDIKYYICLDNITESHPINKYRELEKPLGFIIITGFHFYNFYLNNKYCGKCGNKLKFGTIERTMICECGNTIYPKISPAVIVGIINKDKILLTKYSVGYSRYALVAGFNEIGETLEDTVKREVYEEVGLHINNIRYYKSQPWGQSGSLLAGFFVDCVGDTNPKLLDGELKEATWFDRTMLNDIENDGISLTREMIAYFKENGDKF